MALPTKVARAFVDPFDQMQRDLDTVFGRLMHRDGGQASFAPYGVDIREDADHIYVEAELPGYSKDEVDITLENQVLTIAAERKQDKQENKGEWLLNERRYSRFLRSFSLPPTVDESAVDAKLDHGVLILTLSKREESKPRKIKLS